jgi:hypothetical protein
VIPDSGHDWHTAGVALADGVRWFMVRTQLATAGQSQRDVSPKR